MRAEYGFFSLFSYIAKTIQNMIRGVDSLANPKEKQKLMASSESSLFSSLSASLRNFVSDRCMYSRWSGQLFFKTLLFYVMSWCVYVCVCSFCKCFRVLVAQTIKLNSFIDFVSPQMVVRFILNIMRRN